MMVKNNGYYCTVVSALSEKRFIHRCERRRFSYLFLTCRAPRCKNCPTEEELLPDNSASRWIFFLKQVEYDEHLARLLLHIKKAGVCHTVELSHTLVSSFTKDNK